MAKLFVVAGHGAGDPGAGGNGYQEAERVRALASRIKELGGSSVTIGDTSKDWYRSNLFSSLSISKDTMVVELHLDSATASARGGHVIIKSGLAPDAFDNALANFVSSFFPGRSSKIVGRNDLQNVNVCSQRGINYRLLECCFISSSSDMAKFNSQMDTFAKGVLKAAGIGNDPMSNGVNLQLYHTNSTKAQQFREVIVKGKTKKISGTVCQGVRLRNAATGKYVDVAGAIVKNGTNVQVYPENGTDAQLWYREIIQYETDTVIIYHSALNINYVLDIAGGSYDDGANAQLYKANGSLAQQFVQVFAVRSSAGNPYYYLINQGSGKALDVVRGGR